MAHLHSIRIGHWLLGFAAMIGPTAGCTRADTPRPTAENRSNARQPAAIFVSGDTAGWIVPCGCTSNQSGGLPRRGDWIQRQQGEVAYADVGGAASGGTPYERINFEAILDAETLLGIAAHNIGAPEAALGADYLLQQGEQRSFPWVSANVHDATGKRLFPAFRVATTGGRRIGFIGVLSPELAPSSVAVSEPRDAVLSAVDALAGDADVLVVLAYMKAEPLRQLASSLPEVDMVIGGPTGQSMPPQRLGPTWVASATNKGKFVLEFRAEGAGAWRGEVVELTGDFTDHPEQLENLQQYYDRLRAADLPADQTPFQPQLPTQLPAAYRIVGAAACRDCHDQDHMTWKSTSHASAWRPLEQLGADVDARCQHCHATGFGIPGGFLSRQRSPNATHVSCESCHGPSAAHAQDPRQPTLFSGRAEQQCLFCHDRENSPDFEPTEYWEKIQHGKVES